MFFVFEVQTFHRVMYPAYRITVSLLVVLKELRTARYTIFHGKITISMAMFYRYVNLCQRGMVLTSRLLGSHRRSNEVNM